MDRVLLADDLSRHDTAIAAMDAAALALERVVVDAAKLAHAERPVVVEATDDEAERIEVGSHHHGLGRVLALDLHIGRCLVVRVHLIAPGSEAVFEPCMDLRVIADRRVDRYELAREGEKVLCLDLVCRICHLMPPASLRRAARAPRACPPLPRAPAPARTHGRRGRYSSRHSGCSTGSHGS